MSSYAAKTTVTPEKSRSEIERTLARYGAESFAYGWDANRAAINFRVHNRQVRFLPPLPLVDDPEFATYRRGSSTIRRTPAATRVQWEQAIRRRWRALALCIKAKLEAVETGISSFEEEFLAYIVLPDGSTVGEWAAPQIEQVYTTGRMPPMMLALGSGEESGDG